VYKRKGAKSSFEGGLNPISKGGGGRPIPTKTLYPGRARKIGERDTDDFFGGSGMGGCSLLERDLPGSSESHYSRKRQN